MANNSINITITAKDLASSTLKGVGNNIASLSSKALDGGKIMAAASAVGFGAIAKSAISSASAFEQSRIAFDTMLGDSKKAAKLMSDIADAAKATPFELSDLVAGSKQLLAFGVEQEDIIETMTRLGDVASGVGVPIGQLTNVFGQVKVAGRLMGQDLLQFTNAGVPLIETLAKTMNKPQTEIKKLVEQGKVGFDDVKVAIESLTDEGGKFGGLMEKQSKSLSGIFSNIKDSMTLLGLELIGVSKTGDIIEGGLFDKIKSGAEIVLPKLAELPKVIGGYVKQFSPVIDVFKAVFKSVSDFVKKHSDAFKKIAKNFGIVVPIMIAFAGIWAVITSPIAAFLAAAAAVAIAITAMREVWERWGDSIKNVMSIVANVLMPAFSSLKDAVVNNLMPAVMEFWNFVQPVLIPALQVMGTIIGTYVVVGIWQLVNAVKVVVLVLSTVLNVVRSIASFLVGTFSGALRIVIGAFNAVKAVAVGAFNTIRSLAQGAASFVSSVWNGARNAVSGVFENISNIARGKIEAIKGFFVQLKNKGVSVFEGIASVAKGIWDGIIQGIKDAFNSVIDIFNKAIRSYNSVPLAPDIPEIPKLSRGTRFFGGGQAIVGEGTTRGELVTLPRGSQVTPAERTSDLIGGTTSTITIQNLNVNGAAGLEEIMKVLKRNGELSELGMFV